MENNKKGNILIIIVIILLVILIGLVGFYIYNDMNKNEENNTVSNNNGIPKLTKDSQIVQYLSNVFFDDAVADNSAVDMIYTLLYGTEEEKLHVKLIIAYDIATKDKVDCKDLEKYKLTNVEFEYNGIAICGRNNLFEEYGEDYDKITEKYNSKEFNDWVYQNNSTTLVKKEVFDNTMKKLFGEDIKYTYEDLMSYCTSVIFDKKVNGYVEYNGVGYCSFTGYDLQLSNIRQDRNKLSLVYKNFEIYDHKGENRKKMTLVLNFKLDKNGNYIFVDAVEEK